MSATLTACQRLQEADQAYHDLIRGAMVRSVTDENGESVSYSQSDREQLLSYIRTLQVLCPEYQATSGIMQVRRPIRFVF